MIPKHWIYHVWDSEYNYLGTIKNVKSEFVLTLDINSAGPSPITIDISLSTDTAQLPVKVLTTEDGKYITTEDGKYITTEGEATNYGVRGSQVFNGNIVQVLEVSNYHPTGKIVYTGRIKRWRKKSRNNLVSLFVTPLSYDVNNHLVKSGEILHIERTDSGNNIDIYGGTTGRRVTGGWNTNAADSLSSMTLMLAAQSTPVDVTIYAVKLPGSYSLSELNTIFSNPAAYGGIASQTVTVSGTSPQEYNIPFTIPVDLEPNSSGDTPYQFGFYATGSSGTGAKLYYSSTHFSYDTDAYPFFLLMTGSSTQFGPDNSSAHYYNLYAKAYTIPPYTKATITNFVASNLLKTIMNNYISEGGLVTYDAADIGNTGETIPSYTFSANTVKEGIDEMLSFAGKDWYYTIDPGLNTLVFKQANTVTADHVLTYRKEIGDIDLEASIERVKNAVYFTGGDTGSGTNLFLLEENDESIDSFGVEIDRITDIRVTNSGTGTSKAQKHLDRNDDEAYETEVEIYDGLVDITQYLPGQTIGFQGYDSFIDSLILPIVRVTRYGEKVILSLGVLPYRESSAVQQLQDTLLSIQTIDNPTAPS